MSARKISVSILFGLAASAAQADSVFQWGPWVALPNEPTASGGLPNINNNNLTGNTGGVDTKSPDNKRARPLPERDMRRLIEMAGRTGPLDNGTPAAHPGDWVAYAASGWSTSQETKPVMAIPAGAPFDVCAMAPQFCVTTTKLDSGGESLTGNYRLRPEEKSIKAVFVKQDGSILVLDQNPGFWNSDESFSVDNGQIMAAQTGLVHKRPRDEAGVARGNLFGNGVDQRSMVVYAGAPTSLPDMTALKAGQVTAAYSGSAFNGAHAVNIKVDFGAAQWKGSWAGGNVYDNLKGGSNFDASGTIQGANIAGTASGTGIQSGTVQGSFVGPQASGLIGATQLIVETKAGGTMQVNDVFSAQKDGLGKIKGPPEQKK